MPEYIVRKSRSRTASNTHNYAISPEVKQPIVRPFGSSFFPSCIEMWNALPSDIKSVQSNNEFLMKLKNHIWQEISSKYLLEPD